MKTTVLLLFFFYSFNVFAQFFPSAIFKDKRLGAACFKTKLDLGTLAYLSEERMKASVFWVMADKDAPLGPFRLAKYDSSFAEAARLYSVPFDLLKAVAFVESPYGKTNARSWAGAYGLMQLMPGTARDYGLTRDERGEPRKCIPAGAKYLRDLYDCFGRWDFAAMAYHMGRQNGLDVIELAVFDLCGDSVAVNSKNAKEIVEKYNLSYPLIYFGAEPGSRLYGKLTSLKDYSMNYLWSVEAAKLILKMDTSQFDYVCREVVPAIEKPYRFFLWCEDSSFSERIATTPFSSSRMDKLLDWDKEGGEEEPEFILSYEAAGAALLISATLRELADTSIVIEIAPTDSVPKQCRYSAFLLKTYGKKENEILAFVLKRLSDFTFISTKPEDGRWLVVASPENEKRGVFLEILLEAEECEEAKEYQNE